MPFSIGDVVIRNDSVSSEDCADDDRDEIEEGCHGVVIELDNRHRSQSYLVTWTRPNRTNRSFDWWMAEDAMDLVRQKSPEEIKLEKEQNVIKKIKYLTDKYLKSRTVSTPVICVPSGSKSPI